MYISVKTIIYVLILSLAFNCVSKILTSASSHENELVFSDVLFVKENETNQVSNDIFIVKGEDQIFENEVYKVDASFLEILHDVFQPLRFRALENYPYENVSEICTRSLTLYVEALRLWEPWAIRMFDASGKFTDATTLSTYIEFGSFDDCMEIEVDSNNGHQPLGTQYCMVSFKTPILQPKIKRVKTPSGRNYFDAYGPSPEWIMDDYIQLSHGIYLGICLPSSCKDEELHKILHSVLNISSLEINVHRCEYSDDSKEWPLLSKISVFIIFLLLTVIVSGTVIDLLDKGNDKAKATDQKFSREILKSFSLHSNITTLFTIKNDDLGVMHLVKVILCSWVVIIHGMIFPVHWMEKHWTNYINLVDILSARAAILDNSTLSVDCFFVLSGFLLAYTLWGILEKTNGKLNITQIIVKRYFRLTPVHLFAIVTLFVLPILGDGPLFNNILDVELGRCRDFVWRNLLYIQNFWGIEELCLSQTWYLAVTMQHLIVSIPLLMLTYKYRKTGLLLGALIIICSAIRDFNVSLENEFSFMRPVALRLTELGMVVASEIYFMPSHHFSAVAVGMVCGWAVRQHKHVKLKRVHRNICWVIAVLFFLFAEFAVYYPTENLKITALYNSTRVVIFSTAIAWFLYAGMTGSSSREKGTTHRINKEEKRKERSSLNYLAPFGQVTFCVYIFNPMIKTYRDSIIRERIYFSNASFLVELVLLYILSFAVGFIVYLFVEEPFNRVLSLMFSKKQRNEKERKRESNGLETKEKEL